MYLQVLEATEKIVNKCGLSYSRKPISNEEIIYETP